MVEKIVPESFWSAIPRLNLRKTVVLQVILILIISLWDVTWTLFIQTGNGESLTVTPNSNSNHKLMVSPLPDKCGKWQVSYAKRHSEILSLPRSQQRLTVFEAIFSGYGDRISSMPSVFLQAILSDRAFVIDWDHEAEPLTKTFDSPYGIQWIADQETLAQHKLSNSLVRLDYYGHQKDMQTVFGKGNLTSLHSDKQSIVITSNQGQLWNLYENPIHKDDLERLGMHPQLAYGCLMRTLFSTNQRIRDILSREASELNVYDTNADMLRIGIQLRFGDDALLNGKTSCANMNQPRVQAFFKCASQIGESCARSATTRIRYFLITDCAPLRAMTKAQYGDMLVTLTNGTIGHTQLQHEVHGYETALAEHWLFSQMDYHVISKLSVFGRTAALQRLQYHSIYTLDDYRKPHQVLCGLQDGSRYEDLSSDWVRV